MRQTYRFIIFSSIVCLLLFSLLLPLPVARSQSESAATLGPLDLSGELHGAPYRIRVPAVWNGTLLVFAHGYRDQADHPGEVDNRNADVAPSAALEPALLAQGYALAGSAYRDNGWEVEGGIQDTKDLTVLFRGLVGQPDRTILWSVSMGSIVALEASNALAASMTAPYVCVRPARAQLASGTLDWRFTSLTTLSLE